MRSTGSLPNRSIICRLNAQLKGEICPGSTSWMLADVQIVASSVSESNSETQPSLSSGCAAAAVTGRACRM